MTAKKRTNGTNLDLGVALKTAIEGMLKEVWEVVKKDAEDSQQLLLDDPDEEESVSEGDSSSGSADELIKTLNDIRSGHSFDDQAVRKAIEEFLSTLDDSQRSNAKNFLDGIAKIVTGTVASAKIEPKSPATQEFEPSSIKKTPTGKKTVVKKPVVKSGKKSSSEKEDTSAPIDVPITPKK
jgi:hypothetical protein